MSRESTRADAVSKGADEAVASGPGSREWIEELEPTPSTAVAAFDTRVRRPRIPGSAARAARKHLRSRGFKAVGPPTTFWVDGMTGPLHDGEEARARQWGADLGTAWVTQRALAFLIGCENPLRLRVLAFWLPSDPSIPTTSFCMLMTS